MYIYYRTDTGKYYELDTALPRVRRTSGTLYPTRNISRYLCDNIRSGDVPCNKTSGHMTLKILENIVIVRDLNV